MTDLIARRIATELSVREEQVSAAVKLLDEGATVPFVARYRKEVTGGLDDTQLRTLEERLLYLRELEERRKTILASIAEQGKLTPELERDILAADTKNLLEDLYLPYRPKRRTKAMIAREAGLQPLADLLLRDHAPAPELAAQPFVAADKGVADVAAALDGARQILMEQFAEDGKLVGELREHLWQRALLRSTVEEGKETEGAKFSDYFHAEEAFGGIPSHRALALLRGRSEGILRLQLALDPEAPGQAAGPWDGATAKFCEGKVGMHFGLGDKGKPADKWLMEAGRSAWRIKILPHLETELMVRLREAAEEEAIKVFGRNLHDLLLAAPAGPRAILGLDPGLRTGVKVAVVDRTGKVLDTGAIFPHEPRNDWDRSLAALAALCSKHKVELISIGNGTASRETDKLVHELMRKHPELKLQKLVVSEAGASVYSASELAALEFPQLDVTLRGAVSIARRLQDPLAELCKIDPKAIGVGQYQHDVDQSRLARTLDAVVEDCVNKVGVDVNTASAPLLARVAGLNKTLAQNIVSYRDEHGAFADRKALLEVPRLGKKAFEQAAGFLRIRGGGNPLDCSAVHPEAYPVVERILQRTGLPIEQLIGNTGALRQLTPQQFADTTFGVPTVTDILKELEKPGRDPRPEFKTASFQDGVEKLEDLRPDMVLEGVVTNVTNFGAFVDIGVHQDGLVHISCMSDKFVKDPHEVVKAGQVVKVKVLEVDLPRKRVALTMRLSDVPGQKHRPAGSSPAQAGGERRGPPPREARQSYTPRPEPEIESPLAKQLAKLRDKFKGS